jgi:hypothetical protein
MAPIAIDRQWLVGLPASYGLLHGTAFLNPARILHMSLSAESKVVANDPAKPDFSGDWRFDIGNDAEASVPERDNPR